MTSLRDLKAATVAELTAVRGITEIKAQQIHDYLAQFAELHDPPVALPTLVLVETAPLERALLLIGTAFLLSREWGRLLRRTPEIELRPRLLKQWDVYEEVFIPFVGELAYLSPSDMDRTEALLGAMLADFQRTHREDKFSKKVQGELADQLETFHAAIAALTPKEQHTAR